MFESLFGSEMPLAARFFIAFLVVLALIGFIAWLVRRFGSSRLGAGARGRQPRLAVIDAAHVDGRRRLVLIRRDNVEHLLMIGGPTDVVVEQNIVRAAGARDAAPVRTNGIEAPATRAAPAMDTAWPLQPVNEPLAATPSPRTTRGTAADEPWLPPDPNARPRPADSFVNFSAPPPVTRSVADFAPPPRIEPVTAPRLPEPAPVPPPAQDGDQNLAEMAQQLEAALRRPPGAENRPPVTDPLAMPRPAEPPRAPLRDFKPPRAEP